MNAAYGIIIEMKYEKHVFAIQFCCIRPFDYHCKMTLFGLLLPLSDEAQSHPSSSQADSGI